MMKKYWNLSIQMIFQNPFASLNPRMTLAQTLNESVRFHYPNLSADAVDDKVDTVLLSVGLAQSQKKRYPHEFSGGQQQRISIARALVIEPHFLIADEPVSALDISVQAQVLNVLKDIHQQRRLTIFFISHDLSVVRYFASDVGVLFLGALCEIAPKQMLFDNPLHPYSRALLDATPKILGGQTSNSKAPITLNSPQKSEDGSAVGCPLVWRCPFAKEVCHQQTPQLKAADNANHLVACHGIDENWIHE